MTNYRIADHKIFRIDGEDYLFLVDDKAIFQMDESTRTVLGNWPAQPEASPKDIFAPLTGPAQEEQKDVLQGLIQRRLVLPVNGHAPQTRADRKKSAAIPLATLILHVTEACNLSCRYCYQRTDRPSGRGSRAMGIETAKKAVDFLIQHSQDLKDIVLVFFGGEPLLNFPVIGPTVDYACRKASQAGKRIEFALTTNGTLLTPEIIEFLRQRNIAVTISLDGWQKTHDRFRRFADGRPSYAAIVRNLDRLLARADARPVVARVTLAEKAEDLCEMTEHLLRLGFVEVGFAPVTTGHPDFQLNSSQMDLLLDQFGRLAQVFLEAALSGRFFGFSNLIDLLVSLHQGDVMNYPCGAGLGLFAVGPDGRLYLCQRFTGDDRFCMGSIAQGFMLERLAEFRSEAEIANKAICRSCWVRTICTGGCYHEACVREGSHLSPNLHYCDWIKRWTELGFATYCRIASQKADFLDMICASRGYRA